MEPDELSTSVWSAAGDPMKWPLELGETLIVYHPHTKLMPKVVPTRELAAISRSSGDLEGLLLSDFDSQPPHFPFKTLADFEQTAVCET